MARALLILTVVTMAVSCVLGTKYFEETFSTPYSARWVQSKAKENYGKVAQTAGKAYGDAAINTGLQTSDDSHFYALSSKLSKPFDNRGKKLVVSFSVKHEQGIDCGGGYIKLLPKTDAAAFSGDSEYFMMFGPDICGHSRKVHLIFHYKGKNHLWKKIPHCPIDRLTHVYTVIVNPDNTYEVQIDGKRIEGGDLSDDWDFLEPKEIDDPSHQKPSDWVDEPELDDPSDTKPADWDREPRTLPDPNASEPEDWDESEDGPWEPRQIPNPKYKGIWSPRRIANPAYKGPWISKKIPNPAYVADPDLYVSRYPIDAVGIDIWQVKAGTIFDNIIVSDDESEVQKFIDQTWGATKDGEKKMFDAHRSHAQQQQAKAAEPEELDDALQYEATKRMYEEEDLENEDL